MTIDEIFIQIGKIQKLRIDLAKEQQVIDKEVGDCYHILEICKLNAVQQAQVTKKLKASLQRRREVKEMMSVIQGICDVKFEDIKSKEYYLNKSSARTAQYKNEAEQAFEKFFNQNNASNDVQDQISRL